MLPLHRSPIPDYSISERGGWISFQAGENPLAPKKYIESQLSTYIAVYQEFSVKPLKIGYISGTSCT